MTGYVLYEDVRVPVENLLGGENEGFKCIMLNFNHERWMIIVAIVRACRAVTARQGSAEHVSRLKALHCTAMAWIFIPAYCFAIP